MISLSKELSFKELSLTPEIQRAVDELGFSTPTEIQQRTIPLLLTNQSVDLHGQAQTGTGKTFAFGIPLIQKLDLSKKGGVQALIVAPTRELVVQTTQSLRKLAKYVPITIEPIYGGVSLPEQVKALRSDVHIVVGTPGRLNDHLKRKTLSLKQLKVLVLDEADIMLDMGFKEEVDEILLHIPKSRQIWLFSATVKSGINDIMRNHMKSPISVRVSAQQIAAPATKQYYCIVQPRQRVEALSRFIDSVPSFYGFVFCPTKILTSEIAEKLAARGYKVNALHGDLSQAQRNRVIKKFREKDFSILVATDVAARGIDIADLTHVINYSLPDDLESYVHRIGRTGRAGKEGIAIALINPYELRRIKMLERTFKVDIRPITAPSGQEIATIRGQAADEYVNEVIKNQHTMPHYDALEKIVMHHSAHDIKKVLVTILYDKFLRGLIQGDIAAVPVQDDTAVSDGMVELYVGLGEEHGAHKNTIIDLLSSTGAIKKDDIRRVKILRKHSFVVIPAQGVATLLEALHLKKVRVHVTEDHVQPREQQHARKKFGRRRR